MTSEERARRTKEAMEKENCREMFLGMFDTLHKKFYDEKTRYFMEEPERTKTIVQTMAEIYKMLFI